MHTSPKAQQSHLIQSSLIWYQTKHWNMLDLEFCLDSQLIVLTHSNSHLIMPDFFCQNCALIPEKFTKVSDNVDLSVWPTRTKSYLGLFWAETHPPCKFFEISWKVFVQSCQQTNQQTDWVNWSDHLGQFHGDINDLKSFNPVWHLLSKHMTGTGRQFSQLRWMHYRHKLLICIATVRCSVLQRC